VKLAGMEQKQSETMLTLVLFSDVWMMHLWTSHNVWNPRRSTWNSVGCPNTLVCNSKEGGLEHTHGLPGAMSLINDFLARSQEVGGDFQNGMSIYTFQDAAECTSGLRSWFMALLFLTWLPIFSSL
jgi:hypothetical protein